MNDNNSLRPTVLAVALGMSASLLAPPLLAAEESGPEAGEASVLDAAEPGDESAASNAAATAAAAAPEDGAPPIGDAVETAEPAVAFTSEDNAKFFRACWTGNVAMVRNYLDLGMSPDAGAGRNPCVVQAARHGQTEVTELLVARKADLDAVDVNGWTALIWAAYQGYPEVAAVLLQAGADPDQRNKFGATALLHAAFEGRDRVARLLLEHDADFTLTNDKGYDPMRAANTKGFYNIVNMLVKAGAEPVTERTGGDDAK